MTDKDPTVWDSIIVWAALSGAWLTGESGRVIVAGGFGGLARWISTERERRRLRDGILAIIGGVITGQYLWPLGLHIPRIVGAEQFPETPDNIALAAFVIGTMGVSTVKIIAAIIERQASRFTGGGVDGEDA